MLPMIGQSVQSVRGQVGKEKQGSMEWMEPVTSEMIPHITKSTKLAGPAPVRSSRRKLEGHPLNLQGQPTHWARRRVCTGRSSFVQRSGRKDQKGLVSGGQGKTDSGVFDGPASAWMSFVGPVIARQSSWASIMTAMSSHVEPAVSVWQQFHLVPMSFFTFLSI